MSRENNYVCENKNHKTDRKRQAPKRKDSIPTRKTELSKRKDSIPAHKTELSKRNHPAHGQKDDEVMPKVYVSHSAEQWINIQIERRGWDAPVLKLTWEGYRCRGPLMKAALAEKEGDQLVTWPAKPIPLCIQPELVSHLQSFNVINIHSDESDDPQFLIVKGRPRRSK